jgi:hypothetical protein
MRRLDRPDVFGRDHPTLPNMSRSFVYATKGVMTRPESKICSRCNETGWDRADRCGRDRGPVHIPTGGERNAPSPERSRALSFRQDTSPNSIEV